MKKYTEETLGKALTVAFMHEGHMRRCSSLGNLFTVDMYIQNKTKTELRQKA